MWTQSTNFIELDFEGYCNSELRQFKFDNGAVRNNISENLNMLKI